jgi:hypothetical protein
MRKISTMAALAAAAMFAGYRAPYRWVRIQQPTDTRLWATISKRGV